MERILPESRLTGLRYLTTLLFLLLLTGFFTVVQAQTATLNTDKSDYAPGEPVIITGSGWQPGENVNLLIEHNFFIDHPDEFKTIEASSSGEIYWDGYVVQGWDLDEIFTLTATGQSSGFIVSKNFTDASTFQNVIVSSQTGNLTYGTSGSVTFTITVNRTGSGNLDVDLSQTITLPNGVTSSFSPSRISFSGNTPMFKTSTMTISTSNGSLAGSFNLNVRGTTPANQGSVSKDGGYTLVISKLSASVVVANKTKEYGSADPVLTGTLTGFLGGDNVVAAYSRVAGETVLGGPYAITAVLTPTAVLSNYNITNTPGAFTITVKEASVIVDSKSKEYGSADPVLTGTLTGFLGGDNVVAAYSRVAGETVLGGPYAITAVLTPTAVLSNYNITNTPGAFTITVKEASVIVDSKSKEYGSADPVLTGTLTGFLGGDNVVAAYSRVAGETVLGGPYAITAVLTPTAVLSNYNITNTPGAFTITVKEASVIVDSKSKEYGSADPVLTGTLTGFLGGDNVVAAYSRVAGETVLGGPYAITAVLTPTAVLSNYNITNTPGAFTITVKEASVIVDSKSKEYGSADPVLTGTLTGFLGGDNVVAAYSRVAGETVLGGPYAITAVLTPTAVLSNYNITNTPGAFTITVKEASVIVDSKSKEYGSADPVLTGTLTGFLGGDNVVAAYSRVAGETVLGGPYAITAVLTPTAVLSNYNITNTPGAFTITVKEASVIVDSKSKEYGSADPVLTGTLTGFLGGDNVVAAYSRVAGETVLGGPYAITAVLTPTAVLSNYNITNTPGAFTITVKEASVIVDSKSKEYGSADPVLTGTLTGFLGGDNVVAAYSRVAGETVLGGPYAITAVLTPTAVLSNYNITNTPGAFTITVKEASVIVDSKSKEYGSADPVLTGTLTGFLGGDNVVAAYSRVAGETVLGGPYAITAVLTPTAVLSNYNITNTPGAFTITVKEASVIVDSKSKEYGSADPVLTGTLTGFLGGDNVVAAYSRVAGETVLGGPYAITAVLTPTAVLSNYNITNTPGAFTITVKEASVIVDSKSKEYGSADPVLTGTLTGFLGGDNVVAAYSRVAGETVLGGPYAITAVLTPTAVLSNYKHYKYSRCIHYHSEGSIGNSR